MSESFQDFMSHLLETNKTLALLTDFKKVTLNVKDVEIRLNELNYLLGKPDQAAAVHDLFERCPEAFGALGILVAVRDSGLKVRGDGGKVVTLGSYFKTEAGVMAFLDQTGLGAVMRSGQVKNLVDYVFGVEVGLDTNARKNRGGTTMETEIAERLRKAGIQFATQVGSDTLPGLEVLGKDRKVFDFIVKTRKATYLIETNFYNGGGSKLNEVARSYTDIAPKVDDTQGYEFVWITDGIGWNAAKSKLEEAYSIVTSVYNLTNLGVFMSRVQKEGPVEP